jgi:hypothetical protein
VSSQASVKVRASQDNVAGVKLPKFESLKEGQDSKLGLIGLGSGGKQIQECRCAAQPQAPLPCCLSCALPTLGRLPSCQKPALPCLHTSA